MPEEIMLWKKQVQIIIFKLKEGPPWARVPKVRRKVSFRVKSCVVERILFSLSESEKEKREPASGGGAAPPPKITKEAWLLVKMRYLIEIIRPLPPSIRMTRVLY